MLFYDQSITKGYHEKYAKYTAAKRDQCNFYKSRFFSKAFFCPQEQGRHCEDRSCCKRLTCRTDGLNQVALQNGVFLHNHAYNTHGNNCCRNGSRYCHTNAKTKISIGCAEYNCEDHTHDYGCHRHFRCDFFSRNIRFELFVVH